MFVRGSSCAAHELPWADPDGTAVRDCGSGPVSGGCPPGRVRLAAGARPGSVATGFARGLLVLVPCARRQMATPPPPVWSGRPRAFGGPQPPEDPHQEAPEHRHEKIGKRHRTPLGVSQVPHPRDEAGDPGRRNPEKEGGTRHRTPHPSETTALKPPLQAAGRRRADSPKDLSPQVRVPGPSDQGPRRDGEPRHAVRHDVPGPSRAKRPNRSQFRNCPRLSRATPGRSETKVRRAARLT